METGMIQFQDSEFSTAKDEVTQIIYLAMKPFVDAMGLSWKSQMVKLQSDVRFDLKEIEYQTNGGIQKMLSMTTDHLPAYLYSINPNKVRKDLRDRILTFQAETFEVINSYWRDKFSQESEFQTQTKDSAQKIETELSAIQRVFDNSNFRDSKKIEMLRKLYEKIGLETIYFPKQFFIKNSLSLTKLLEKFEVDLTAHELNPKLEKLNLIEKRFVDENSYLWFILKKGEEFGENEKYQDRTTPKYFEHKFQELLELISEK